MICFFALIRITCLGHLHSFWIKAKLENDIALHHVSLIRPKLSVTLWPNMTKLEATPSTGRQSVKIMSCTCCWYRTSIFFKMNKSLSASMQCDATGHPQVMVKRGPSIKIVCPTLWVGTLLVSLQITGSATICSHIEPYTSHGPQVEDLFFLLVCWRNSIFI